MAKPNLQLEKLEIRKTVSYRGEAPNHYIAEVEYEGTSGKISLPLPIEVSEKLLAFIAPVLAEFGRKAAEDIANNLFQSLETVQQPAIEATTETATTETSP